MFKKVIFIFVLVLNSLFADVSLGVIANHGYIEFDTVDEFNVDQGDNWVAIYKQGDSTDWDNVISWSWIRDLPSHGEKTYDFEFEDLDDTTLYELRFFYNNSYDIAQSIEFGFDGSEPFLEIVSYDSDTLDLISSNIDLNTNSWVGIYEKGLSNDWDNVLAWNWVDSTTFNDKDYKSTIEGLTLSDGVYDIRLFYNNSFDMEASKELIVGDTTQNPLTRQELINMIRNGEDVTQVDVSEISDMNYLFRYQYDFNQDISGWDVSNVTNMSHMFEGALKFNQPIGSWDVSNVTDMSYMFRRALEFNQPIGDWDVSNVSDMSGMFHGSYSHGHGGTSIRRTIFNQDISDWDVSNVTDMSSMFYVSLFNQPIGDWDVSNVTNMSGMFDTTVFDQPIGDWDVSSVTNMSRMFDGCYAKDSTPGRDRIDEKQRSLFNQPIGGWDVSNVTDMSYMFCWTEEFNQPIGDWDVSSVTNMSGMFHITINFNQPIGNWDVSNVIKHENFAIDSHLQEDYQPHFQQ